MAPMPVQRASDGAAFVGRTARGQIPLLLAVPLLLLAALLVAPVHALVARPVLTFSGAAATDLPPAELTALAATLLERATAEGGSGYTFTIVQHASLDRRPGGPPIAIDPLDEQGKGGSTTDHYALATYLERGAASSAGFWLEIRDGPVGDEPPDFEGATYQLGAIVRDDKTFRNDGDGWYRTDDPPGIGLDPRTAGLLPAMLRGATGTKDRDQAPGDDPTADRGLEATTTVAELPGLIAVDAETFTEFVGPLELDFDDTGRLVRLRGLARNTSLADEVDMLVDTEISFDYPLFAPDIPRPEPIIDPDASASPDGEG